MAHPQASAVSYELVRVFPVQGKRVWRALTDPEALAAWAWGRNASDVAVNIDLRVGGMYSVYTASDDESARASEGWGVCGIYVEIVPERRLAYTQHWTASVGYNDGQDVVDELVTVELRQIDAQTEVRYRHFGIPNDGKAAQRHADAVRSTLDDLGILLADGVL